MWKKQERGNRKPWWAESEEPSEARGEGSNTRRGTRVGKKGEAEGHKADERDERSGRMNICMAEEGIWQRKESKVIGERVWEGTSEEQMRMIGREDRETYRRSIEHPKKCDVRSWRVIIRNL
jgi:hypothetical protein